MIPRLSEKYTEQLSAEGANYTTKIVGPWVLAYGLGSGFRVYDEAQGLSTANWRQRTQWRVASVTPDLPGLWTQSANIRSNAGQGTEDFTVTASNPMWVQAGLAVASVSGVSEALSSLQSAAVSRAQIIARGGFQIEPDLNSTQTAFFPIGDPVPAAGLAGLMFAVVTTGVSGSFTFDPAYRTMQRRDEPGAWIAKASARTISANDRFNFGDWVVTSTDMWIQPGIKVTTAAMATVQAIVAGRY